VLRTPQYKEYCKGRALGTTNLSLSRDDFLAYELPEEDKKRCDIVNLLENIESKTSLSNQINQTLEQMAQALFKSWFVDFDPVVDNALDAGFFEQDLAFPDELLRRAEARRAVREHGDFKPLPDATRQLFPATFEECAEPSLGLGGWVPQGWKHGCVADVARYSTKRIDTEELTLENYISTENMLADRKGIQPAATLPTVNSVPAYATGSILISNIRPYFKKIWLANGSGGHSNDVLGFEAKDSDTECYVFNLMYQDSFFDFMMATSKGSKMPRGDKKAILEWGLIVPPLNLRLFFSEKVSKFYTSSYGRHHENITLAQLRDTLLPKLISGELRLDNIEADLTKV
jgi:type I restriction enzyme, S subunit